MQKKKIRILFYNPQWINRSKHWISTTLTIFLFFLVFIYFCFWLSKVFVATYGIDLYLLSCLSGGFASKSLWPLSQNRHDSEGWLYFLSPKSYTSKTFHQMLKECQHLESTLCLLRVARCYMWDTVADG